MRTLFVLPLLTLACGPGREPPPSNTQPPITVEKNSALAAANSNLKTALMGAARAGVVAEEQELLGTLLGGDVACEPGAECDTTLEGRAAGMADDAALRFLNVANVLVEEPTRIVLRVKPEHACLPVETLDENGNPVTMPEPTCVRSLTEVPVEIELTSRREGDIDLDLTIGGFAVGRLELYRTRIAAEIDFGAAMNAADAIAAARGEPMEIGGTIRGRVRAELIQNGQNDWTAQIAIVSALEVDATISGEPFRLSVGVSNPLASIRLDGNTPQIVTEANIGAIEATIPLGIVPSGECEPAAPGEPTSCGESTLDGALSISAGASRTRVTFDRSPEIRIHHTSGGVTVERNGLPLLSYQLNPNHRGEVDARLVSEENGFLVSVTPLLDIRARFDFANFPEAEVPEILLSDSIQLLLDGAAEPAVRFAAVSDVESTPDGEVRTERSVIEVVRGRLLLSSSNAGRTVSVDAGMCLDAREGTEGEHPFDLLTAAVCE